MNNLNKETIAEFVSEVRKLANKYNLSVHLNLDTTINDSDNLSDEIKITFKPLQEPTDPGIADAESAPDTAKSIFANTDKIVNEESETALSILIDNVDYDTKLKLMNANIGLNILANDSNPEIRIAVAEKIIGMYRYDINVKYEKELNALIHDSDPYVRTKIVKELAFAMTNGLVQDQCKDKFTSYINDLSDSSEIKLELISLGYIDNNFINDSDPKVILALLESSLSYIKQISADQMKAVIKYVKGLNRQISSFIKL